jgi:uracil-DNA glycosylase family 4
VLFAALHATGFASQPASTTATDGLRISGAYIAAVNRCAPPGNRPTPEERENCLPYLVAELSLLADVRVIVALGSFAWDGTLRALATRGEHAVGRRPVFGHGAEAWIGRYHLLGCFHPSQQNTFTGKLTPPMIEAILRRAAQIGAS